MSKNYKNVTKEWLKNAIPNSHEVKEARYFKDKEGNKYYVDGKYVILDYSKKEKEVAEWLKKTFGGEIYLLPRVNIPENIKTADYLFRGKNFDLKTLSGTSKIFLSDGIKTSKRQAANFIIDVSSNPLDISEILKQAQEIYDSYYRRWVNIIIIKKDCNLIAVYKRKNSK